MSGVAERLDGQGGRLVAVLVLYRMEAKESAAYRSLMRVASESLPAAGLDLMICDNSPVEQEAPAGFGGVYWRDRSNPGLAIAYNRAFERARKKGATWLMLLDQDTTLTEAYFAEVERLTVALEAETEVVALTPKLMERGQAVSPHRPPALRHYRGEPGFTGVARTRMCAFNSGAVLRVRAMEEAGGFDEEFWLDFLDHATFWKLQQRGGRMYVMEARLEHELALSRPGGATFSEARHRNSVDAECAFYRKYGTARERMCLRARMIWSAMGGIVKRGDVRRARYMLGAAMGRRALPERTDVQG
ncbi:MAG: glycosyltransferase [Acidobacteriaceae bacterium]